MGLPYRIANGVVLTAGIIGLTGNAYARQNEIAPSKPLATQQSVSQPLESRASEKQIVNPSREDLQYILRVSNAQPFHFLDAKTGKDVRVDAISSLYLKTDVDGVGTVEYRGAVFRPELGAVTIKNGEAKIEVTPQNINGTNGGYLEATNPDVWRDYESEFSRLMQAAIDEARKRFPDAATQEKSLVDLVNKK